MTKEKSQRLYDVIVLIRPLMKKLIEAVEGEMEGTGITIAMRAVLERLADHEKRSVPEISRLMMLKRQSVQPIVDKLLEMGTLTRVANPIHKKSPLIQLTSRGSQIIDSIRNKEQANLTHIASSYDEAELEITSRVLSELTEHFSNFNQWRTL